MRAKLKLSRPRSVPPLAANGLTSRTGRPRLLSRQAVRRRAANGRAGPMARANGPDPGHGRGRPAAHVADARHGDRGAAGITAPWPQRGRALGASRGSRRVAVGPPTTASTAPRPPARRPHERRRPAHHASPALRAHRVRAVRTTAGALAPLGELARDLDGDLMCAQGYGCTVRTPTLRDPLRPRRNRRTCRGRSTWSLCCMVRPRPRAHDHGRAEQFGRALRVLSPPARRGHARAIRRWARGAGRDPRGSRRPKAALARWATAGRGRRGGSRDPRRRLPGLPRARLASRYCCAPRAWWTPSTALSRPGWARRTCQRAGSGVTRGRRAPHRGAHARCGWCARTRAVGREPRRNAQRRDRRRRSASSRGNARGGSGRWSTG